MSVHHRLPGCDTVAKTDIASIRRDQSHRRLPRGPPSVSIRHVPENGEFPPGSPLAQLVLPTPCISNEDMRWRISRGVLAAFTWFCGIAPGQSDHPRFGIAVTASTLGLGIQGATAVTAHSNIRGGFNIFEYSHDFDKDGVNYKGNLKLRSFQVTYDHFFGGFHISPGFLIYNGNKGEATATVPAGQVFNLGGTGFYSSQISPVGGDGALTVRKAAPMLLIGFGNLLPRSARHFGINIEGGVVFEGSPTVRLKLGGSTCLINAQTGCVNTATDPTVQRSLTAEESKLNDDVGPFRYYPVISIGFSYKF
jgi:hypothetical protein